VELSNFQDFCARRSRGERGMYSQVLVAAESSSAGHSEELGLCLGPEHLRQ
jgi:hypothetical protein